MRAHLAPAKRDAEVPEKNAPTQRAEKGRAENTTPVRIPTYNGVIAEKENVEIRH